MRDLLFRNFTSNDKRRKVIASSEVFEKEGVRSIIRRHFICMVREVAEANLKKPLPYLYVVKERNTKEQKEKFFCRIKGSIYVVHNGKLFQVIFTHSLKIGLEYMPQLMPNN